MNRWTDQEIYKSINSGDEDIFEFIFLTYYNELCIYACGLLKERESAEEMVQEVFVKLWESHKTLTVNQSIKAYLYRAVHNHCLNYLNHKQVELRYASRLEKHNNDIISPVSSEYPITNLLVQELEEKIDLSIKNLPEGCREVFLLIRHEDLSYYEAAEKLGVSVNTIKTQLKRALSRLRENLKEFLPLLLLFISVK